MLWWLRPPRGVSLCIVLAAPHFTRQRIGDYVPTYYSNNRDFGNLLFYGQFSLGLGLVRVRVGNAS